MAECTVKFGEFEVSIKDEKAEFESCIEKAVNTLLDLNSQMANSKGGGDKKCTYASKDYSPGSIIDTPGGKMKCDQNGNKWVSIPG